jgi:hypothetical protein
MLDSLRGRVPRWPGVGAVVERDGPIVRTHYGTHGTVDHAPLAPGDLDALVARQVEAFASRGEPAEWKVYAHDEADVTPHLLAAGFTPGWARAVLVGPITGAADDDRFRTTWDHEERLRVTELAARCGPHRTPFPEFEADGTPFDRESEVLVTGPEVAAAAWAAEVPETGFMVLEGIADPASTHVADFVGWDWQRSATPAWIRRPAVHQLLAEADGALRDALEAAGMRAVTTVTSYHWRPASPPPATRPVTPLLYEPEHDEVWTQFRKRFDFRPETRVFPGITEPETSATWSLRDGEESVVDDLHEIVHNGLVRGTRPGEPLYWLDWNHIGYRFDPHRVGGRGPRWPGAVFPDGDYYLYLAADLRFGTFGHPWEETLCVFGEPLLTAVETRLTTLLGAPIRRAGK